VRTASSFISLISVGCSSVQPHRRDAHSESAQRAARVVLSDGISRDEAELLATAYFQRYVSGCGGIGALADHGGYWTAQTRIGYAGTPGVPIRVDKRTGAISHDGKPTVYPKDFSS